MGLRNISTPNYFNTSHIRKGINYSIQNFLFLMFVNHLLVRKQKGGFFWKERQCSAIRKGTRQLPVLVSIPHICSSDFLSTTSNSNNTTARQDTRTFGHHQVNTSTEGLSSFHQATWLFILKIRQKNAKIFFTIRIYLSLQNPKNAKDGTESMFGPSWIHVKGEKADGPVYEEIFCKVFYANSKALLRLLKTSIFVSFGKRAQL